MKINYPDWTKDYTESLRYGQALATYQNETKISGDHLFFWVYKYLQKYNFNSLFWKFIWISDLTIFEEYFNSQFWNNIELKTDLVDKNLAVDDYILSDLDKLKDIQNEKLDFVSLLYSAIWNLSQEFVDYLVSKKFHPDKIKIRLLKILKNRNISKIWSVNLFNILNKTIKVLNLDTTNIEMIVNIETLDPTMVKWDILDMDIVDSWSDLDTVDDGSWSTQQNTQINSNIKQEEKKLTVEYFGTDLTKEANDWLLDPVIWREKEINQVIYTLLRKTKNNPLLIWEAWVWKTAIVEWLAQKIVSWEVPNKLRNKRIFMMDMWSLLAWTKYRWEFEARFKAILDEAADPTNHIVLFIDELHTIIWAGNAEWSADAANMLKPLLSRWKIQLIWATTFDEYQKHIEKDPALKRRFQEIVVEEPVREDAIEILKGIKDRFEDYHGVLIPDDVIINSVDLSSRYILNKHLPDKAIDLLDEACARKSTLSEKLKNNDEYKKIETQLENIQKNIEKAIWNQDYFAAAEYKEKEEKLKEELKKLRNQCVLPKNLRPQIQFEDINLVLSDKLWVPVSKIWQTEIEKLRAIDDVLKSKIMWQDESVDALVRALRRNKLSVVKRNKPIASFLFLGPSWVWKTFLAKLIAQEYFGDEKALIRVDMSEFMEKYSVSKLIWSAPWYVWYNEWWMLTEAVRRKPYSVVLFDEIEKASSDVLNILLQILDEWHLKDNKWRWIDFKNTIIILTSNIWSEEFGKKVPKIWFSTADEWTQQEANFEAIKEKVMEQLKDFLSPELLNRLDNVTVFRPLSKDVLGKIFVEKFKEFAEQWKANSSVKLPTFNKKKVEQIITEIYNPQFWARPIERYIHEKIEPELIDQLMKK